MKYEHLELIGIHIKKTAGMSFKKVLKNQYRKGYYRINIRPKEKNREEFFNRKLEEMPENIRVIHGHFHYREIRTLLEDYPDIPVITWLREPVQRAVSQYYYAKMKYENGKKVEDTDFTADMDLVDYAKMKSGTESMSHALSGAKLKDLFFVGVLEHLDEDLAYLAALLDWKEFTMPQRNTNTAYKAQFPAPTQQEIEKVRELFRADVELYRGALALRERRPITPSADFNSRLDVN